VSDSLQPLEEIAQAEGNVRRRRQDVLDACAPKAATSGTHHHVPRTGRDFGPQPKRRAHRKTREEPVTTMIPRYIGIPPEFYDSPKCIEMSHATARFYGFIFWMSHRCSSLQFDVADDDVVKRTKLSPRTLADARKDLAERGLILYIRQQRGYRYIICDPSTGQPFPGDPKEQILHPRKRSKPVGKSAEESDKPPVTQQPTPPQPVVKATVHTLPLRPDGRPDYGFEKSFGGAR
jgi:hypothetical protein